MSRTIITSRAGLTALQNLFTHSEDTTQAAYTKQAGVITNNFDGGGTRFAGPFSGMFGTEIDLAGAAVGQGVFSPSGVVKAGFYSTAVWVYPVNGTMVLTVTDPFGGAVPTFVSGNGASPVLAQGVWRRIGFIATSQALGGLSATAGLWLAKNAGSATNLFIVSGWQMINNNSLGRDGKGAYVMTGAAAVNTGRPRNLVL